MKDIKFREKRIFFIEFFFLFKKKVIKYFDIFQSLINLKWHLRIKIKELEIIKEYYRILIIKL